MSSKTKTVPVFLDISEMDKLYLPMSVISDEYSAMNIQYRVQRKERKGILNFFHDDKSGKLSKKKKFGWFGIGMIVLLVSIIIAVGYLQITAKTYVTQEKFEKIDYYEVLGIPDKSIPTGEIRKFYRKAVWKYHPDNNPDCGEECIKKTSLVHEANTVLMNPETRKWHDDYGVRPPENMIKVAREKLGGRKKFEK